jgi:DNA-binding helix-hairpin-helix protein with protein kinase domain
MSEILKPKQKVRIESTGVTCEVEQFLAGGGQGEVYRASLAGKPVALKWYYEQSATSTQKTALEALVQRGAPNNRFLWPMDMASAEGIPGFGYIMPLREPRYRGIVDLMKRRIEPSFRSLTTAGRELSDSFLKLHSKGLSYCDISFGNVFFDPDNGEVLICDNDNVVFDGKAPADGIAGTARFMAPEIVRGEAMPSTATDLFSLAVLHFYMFMVHHPLEGQKEAEIKCLDLPAMTKLYGKEPVFIFDPADASNRPVKGFHDNALAYWYLYPRFFQQLFIESFTVGLHFPHKRVRESMWRAAMERLSDLILYCGHCGKQNFHDPMATTAACWSCKKPIVKPLGLSLGNDRLVMLNHDTQLFPHHIDEQRLHDFSQPLASVQRHPTNHQVWGLKNLSMQNWSCRLANGSVVDVTPGRSVTLALGTTVHFGNTNGEIV